MKLLALPRGFRARCTTAAVMWWLTCSNIVWGVMDYRERYELVTQTRAARTWCEARGGYYGAADGGDTDCFVPRATSDTSDKSAPNASR